MSENENVAPPILNITNNEKVEKPSEEYTRIFTSSLISKQDCEIFKNLILKPEFIIDGENYFFFPKEVKKKLDELLEETLNKYPYMFEPIRDDLIKYSKEFQTEEFKSKLGAFLTLRREIYFYFHPEERDQNEWIKAKKIAFLLSQLNSQEKKDSYWSNNVYISILNKTDVKFTFDNDEMFQKINTSLSFNSIYDDNIVIMELSNKMENIKQEIYKTRDEKRIKIYISYLISIVERKIAEINNTYKENLLNKEAKITLYKIYDNINLLALRFTIQGERGKKFFYDIEFDYIKVIKNNEKVKQALIENGNLNSFITVFQEEFECIKNFISPIDDDDTEITYENNDIFAKKCLLNIKKLNENKYAKEDQINDIENERLKQSIDSAKKIVLTPNNTNTGEGNNTKGCNNNNLLNKTLENSGEIANIYNIYKTSSMKIKRLSTEEIDKQINYWKKLRNISLLLNKIKDIQNKGECFKGLIITQKFIDNDDTFLVKTI